MRIIFTAGFEDGCLIEPVVEGYIAFIANMIAREQMIGTNVKQVQGMLSLECWNVTHRSSGIQSASENIKNGTCCMGLDDFLSRLILAKFHAF